MTLPLRWAEGDRCVWRDRIWRVAIIMTTGRALLRSLDRQALLRRKVERLERTKKETGR